MSGLAIEALDLAALLCSRVCHDLISPVGAIVNGLEVLEEEKDEETKTIRARSDQEERQHRLGQAAILPHRLRRRRFGRRADRPRRCREHRPRLSRGRQDQARLEPAARLLAKNRVKLLLNMLLIAGQTIPRGGSSRSIPSARAKAWASSVSATGTNAKIPPAVPPLLAGEDGGEPVDAHRIQPFYAGLLARACGIGVRHGHGRRGGGHCRQMSALA